MPRSLTGNVTACRRDSLLFKGRAGVGMGLHQRIDYSHSNPIPLPTSPLKGEEPVRVAFRRHTGLFASLRRSPHKPPALPKVI